MEVIGIIAEYNPFHNGHLYHIKKIKELYPDSLLIAVISTYYCQRGELSIINKWDKTQVALNNNIDLVIELPFVYSTQSADIFAYAALKILNELKVSKIIFGSESNDISLLTKIAKSQLNNQQLDNKIKEYLKNGLNYPTALSKAIKENTTLEIKNPNDLLGISYIKEILKNNYPITPITIQRTNDYHSTEVTSKIVSAKAIRNLIKNNQDITPYCPKNNIKNYYNIDIFNTVKYKIISDQNNLSTYLTVDKDIETRILNSIKKATSYQELIELIKTKRYTYNRLNRMTIHILTSLTKEEAQETTIDYIRILGMNKKSQTYLKNIKKTTSIPIITRYKDINSPLLKIEYRSVQIYSYLTNDPYIIERELKKPIIQ